MADEQVAGARMRLRSRTATRRSTLVAGGVAEGVVDQLEVVEVEVQQRDGGAVARRPGERQVEVLAQQRAVRQARERVVVGEVRDLALGPAALR